MQTLRNRKRPEGKIVKPEDQIWKEQFDHLSKDDHLEKLHLLGLDDEEVEVLIEDFEEVKKGKKSKILQELEEEAESLGKGGGKKREGIPGTTAAETETESEEEIGEDDE